MWIVDMSVKSATMTTHTTREEDKSLDGRTMGWIGHLGRSGFNLGLDVWLTVKQKWRKMTRRGRHSTCKSVEVGNDKHIWKAERRAETGLRETPRGEMLFTQLLGLPGNHQCLQGRPSSITQHGPRLAPNTYQDSANSKSRQHQT